MEMRLRYRSCMRNNQLEPPTPTQPPTLPSLPSLPPSLPPQRGFKTTLPPDTGEGFSCVEPLKLDRKARFVSGNPFFLCFTGLRVKGCLRKFPVHLPLHLCTGHSLHLNIAKPLLVNCPHKNSHSGNH